MATRGVRDVSLLVSLVTYTIIAAMSFFRRPPVLLSADGVASKQSEDDSYRKSDVDSNPEQVTESTDPELEPLYKTVDRHLVPFYCLVVLVNQLDRYVSFSRGSCTFEML